MTDEVTKWHKKRQVLDDRQQQQTKPKSNQIVSAEQQTQIRINRVGGEDHTH